MFGKNKQQPITSDSRHLAVNSIFYTIQGEGPYSGTPALFIRMAGCNLACVWCDTEFDKGLEAPRAIDELIGSILGEFSLPQRRLVVLTGGEPLRQNITQLCELLLSSGTELIQIETAGTVWQPGLEHMIDSGRLVIVCSPKTPGVNPFIERFCTHWKYIIRDGETAFEDGLPNVGTQPSNAGKPMQLFRPSKKQVVVWLSPCDDHDPEQNKKNRDRVKQIALDYGYRVSLQTHKILGVE